MSQPLSLSTREQKSSAGGKRGEGEGGGGMGWGGGRETMVFTLDKVSERYCLHAAVQCGGRGADIDEAMS